MSEEQKVEEHKFHDGLRIYNQESFDKYMELSAHPLLNERKIYTSKHCFDEEGNPLYINIGLLNDRFKIKMKAFTPNEQKLLTALKNQYTKVYIDMIKYKKSAFGTGMKNKDGVGIVSLLDQKHSEIIELFGRMYSSREVYQIIREEWKMKTNIDSINAFRKKHIQIITSKIEEHKRVYSDIRLGIKKSRIEELVWLYNDRKKIYTIKKNKEDYKLMLSTLDSIKKEVEGDRIVFDGHITAKLEQEVTHVVQNEVLKSINVYEIVLARVAAKLGVDVMTLVKSLSESYYNKYNIRQDSENLEDKESILYPSSQTYDFDSIRKFHENKEKLSKVRVLTKTEESRTEFREKLLSKINQAKNNIIDRKEIINKSTSTEYGERTREEQ